MMSENWKSCFRSNNFSPPQESILSKYVNFWLLKWFSSVSSIITRNLRNHGSKNEFIFSVSTTEKKNHQKKSSQQQLQISTLKWWKNHLGRHNWYSWLYLVVVAKLENDYVQQTNVNKWKLISKWIRIIF
jgi:hypothetical protein